MKKLKQPSKKEYYESYFEYEEAFLTNFNNMDKIKRKENKW